MDDPRAFLEQLAQQAGYLTFLFDPEKKQFAYISESAQAFVGLRQEELNQQPDKLLQMIMEKDQHYVQQELSKAAAQKIKPQEVEFRLYMPDQTTRWIRLQTLVVEGAAESNVLLAGIAEDITKRKEYLQGLLGIKEQKNIVIQVLGHDLRAPLNTISMSMSLMGKELNLEENQTLRQLVNIVERTCRNSLDMIKEVLNMEYIETQQMGLKKSRIDVVSRIANQLDAFRLLDKAHKTFLLQSNANSIYASIDSIRLMLIVENLLTNAYKFTRDRGRIEVGIEERESTLLITVADNGIGIPDSLQPLIFDKFTKARRKGNQGELPVGLGMHLIKTMVDQLEGRIWFESKEGLGTTFYVELPR